MGPFDLYSPNFEYQQVIFGKAELSSGRHTRAIRVTGQKNYDLDLSDRLKVYCANNGLYIFVNINQVAIGSYYSLPEERG